MPFKDPVKQRAAWNRWYHQNKKKKMAWQRRRYAENRVWMIELKSKLQCCVCGDDHPAVLDFHHKKGSKKELAVGDAIRHGWSRERILKEISKCDVMCSNCHRKKHWNERDVAQR